MTQMDDEPGNGQTPANPTKNDIPLRGRLVFGSVCVSGPIGLSKAGAPWWAVLVLTAFLSVLALSAICVQTLIPQNSRDRLAWWRDRRRCQRR